MTKTGFALEEVIAQRLYDALNEALPKLRARDKAEIALTILKMLNTLSILPVSKLADFNNAMVDYITLPNDKKENVRSRLCVKITEMKFG